MIGLHRAGVTEAVATCGTALAEGHIKLLTGFSRRIVLAYDADPAGQGAAEHFYDWERRFDAEISVVALPRAPTPPTWRRATPSACARPVSGARPYLGFRLERLFAPPTCVIRRAGPGGGGQPGPDLRAPRLLGPGPVPDAGLGPVPPQPRAAALAAPPRPRRPAGPGPPTLPGAVPAAGPAPGAAPGGHRAGRRAGRRCPGPSWRPCAWPSTVPTRWRAVSTPCCSVRTWPGPTFAELAGAMTLHGAIESAPPEVADLLGQLAVVDSKEDADDVVAPAGGTGGGSRPGGAAPGSQEQYPDLEPRRAGQAYGAVPARLAGAALGGAWARLRGPFGGGGRAIVRFVTGKP